MVYMRIQYVKSINSKYRKLVVQRIVAVKNKACYMKIFVYLVKRTRLIIQ